MYQKGVILSQLGVRETSGKNDGKQINAYRASVAVWLNKMKPLPPWCASFVNWIYQKSDLKTKVKSARARDYFGTQFGSYDPNISIGRVPQFGDAAGYYFGNKVIRHIGIVYEWNPDPKVVMCRIYEGNTSGKSLTGVVCREGDGVYLKWRNKTLVKRITPIHKLLRK
jgi:hypothetical protein